MFRSYIFGSSHVVRFGNFMARNNLGWNLCEHDIVIHGVSGGKVGHAFESLVDIKENNPDSVILLLGSNDIGSHDVKINHVLRKFDLLVEVLLSFGIKLIFISLVLQREYVAPWRGLSLDQHNSRVTELNNGLWSLSNRWPGRVTFWVLRGLICPNYPILEDDGVHLNDEGNRRLHLSLRGALVLAENMLR